MSCLTVNINMHCSEDITTGDFSVLFQRGFGSCRMLTNFTTTTIQLASYSTCLNFSGNPASGFCYRVTLMHQETMIDTQTNLNFATCSISDLESFLENSVSYQLSEPVNQNGTVSHLVRATFTCREAFLTLSGAVNTTCIDGQWNNPRYRLCLQSCTGT